MKLNLLPKTVDTASKAKRAFFGSLLVFAGSCVASFLMVSISSDRLSKATASLESTKAPYSAVVKIANDADAIMAKPEIKHLVANTALAKAMIDANAIYPNLFDSVRPYIPRFFRITQLSATPTDATTCVVNMTGTVKNAQEYADVVLSLLRIPGAINVTRGGFVGDDMIVPPLTLIDQNGRPRKEADAPIPDDALDRLAYFESKQVPSGYLNSGNFGITEIGTVKTVRPTESLITVSVTLPRNIQAPNPRATLTSLPAGPAIAPPTGTPAAGVPAPGQPAPGAPVSAPIAPGQPGNRDN